MLFIIFGLISVTINLLEATSGNKDKVYTFAFSNDGFPYNFQQDGELVGQAVDLVKAVCKVAEKQCKTVLVQRKDCWDTSNGDPPTSRVLDDSWYDSCANYPPTTDRRVSYAFGSENYFNTPEPSLVTSLKSKVTLEELKTCNNRKLVYAANLGLSPECLLELGYYIKPKNRIAVKVSGNGITEMMAVLERMVAKGEMRTDDTKLMTWWNAALKKFICVGNKYRDFCDEIKDVYDRNPLCRRPGRDIDCRNFGNGLVPTRSKTRAADPCVVQCGGLFTVNSPFIISEAMTGELLSSAVAGSGRTYQGPEGETLHVHVTTSIPKQRFFTEMLCISCINVSRIRFIFRGGERKREEIEIPTEQQQTWSEYCIHHPYRRNFIQILFLVKPLKKLKLRVGIRDAAMKACIS